MEGQGWMNTYGIYRTTPKGPNPIHKKFEGHLGNNTYDIYWESLGGPDLIHQKINI